MYEAVDKAFACTDCCVLQRQHRTAMLEEEEEEQRLAVTQLAARVLLAPASAFGGTGEFLCTHLRDASVLAHEVQHRAPGCREE